MRQTIIINFPKLMGSLNENHKSDYIIRLYRTRCNLLLLKRDDTVEDIYGAQGNYEYRIGGNNGQVDEDVVAAVVSNIEKIVYSTVQQDRDREARLRRAFEEDSPIYSYGINDISFKFEEGDWFITFQFAGHLLEEEYVVNVTKV